MNEQAIRFRFGIFVLASLILLAVLTILFGGFPVGLLRASHKPRSNGRRNGPHESNTGQHEDDSDRPSPWSRGVCVSVSDSCNGAH